MKWKFQTAGRLLALLALSGALLAAPLPAQAAPGVLTGLTGTGSKLELELTEMELEITDDDPPAPRATCIPAARAIITLSSG